MKETYLSRDFQETAAQRFPSQAKELNAFFDMRLNALQIVHGYVERLPAIGCWDAPRMAVKTSLKNVGDNMDGDTHVWSIPLYVLWCLKSYLYHEMDW